MQVLSIEQLGAMLDYDPATGTLSWRARDPASFYGRAEFRDGVAARWNREKAGQVAGCLHPNGYRLLTIGRRTYRAARIAWALHTGEWPKGQVDHINHSRDDNRACNLRCVSPAENSRNRGLPADNRSGHVGVDRRKSTGKWRARACVNGRRIELGDFDTAAEAAAARQAASGPLGFHPNHGATS